MRIIRIETNEIGFRPAIQNWDENTPPVGYAVVPDTIDISIFNDSRGFVDIVVEDGIVTAIAVNKEAYEAYLATLPQPDPEDIKRQRSKEIKAACAAAIIKGFDADVLGRGSLHYTLTEIQQRDLQTQYAAIQAGATSALWHDASRVTHEVYTAAQFTALFQAGYAHIIGCKIRSDWLEQLAHDLADAGKIVEAAAVGWDTTLPESYQTQCDAQTTAMLGGTSNGTSA